MEPQGSNTFELVVKDGWPAKIMSNRPDGSYATKDLFLRHEDEGKEHWYKYVGRMDDTLTQTLGEKTNPVPIELAIVSNWLYSSAMEAETRGYREAIHHLYKSVSSSGMDDLKPVLSYFHPNKRLNFLPINLPISMPSGQ